MSRGQRLTFLGIAAVIAVVAVILLAGGGDETSDSGNSASIERYADRDGDGGRHRRGDRHRHRDPEAQAQAAAAAGRQGAGAERQAGRHRPFRVVNDEAEEVHVHGYDIKQELEPGKVETVSFKADITGIFEIELEGSGTLLAQLKVVP